MKLILASKGDGVGIQIQSLLPQQLQSEECERGRYPGARTHIPSASLNVLTWLFLSVDLILMSGTVH